jgi:hypothetical protein
MRATLTLSKLTDVVCSCGYRQIGGRSTVTGRKALPRFRLRKLRRDQVRRRYRRNPWSAALLARSPRSKHVERGRKDIRFSKYEADSALSSVTGSIRRGSKA